MDEASAAKEWDRESDDAVYCSERTELARHGGTGVVLARRVRRIGLEMPRPRKHVFIHHRCTIHHLRPVGGKVPCSIVATTQAHDPFVVSVTVFRI